MPRVVWRSPDLGADVRDIHVEGGVALVATGVLHVLDIGAPRKLLADAAF